MKKEQNNIASKLYDFEKETKKSKRKAEKKSASKKVEKEVQAPKRMRYDDEIIIGVTQFPDEKKRKNGNDREVNNSVKKQKKNKTEEIKIPKEKIKQNKVIKEKNKRNIAKIAKILVLFIIIIIAIIFALLSPLFDIKKIKVYGNSKLSTEAILGLANVKKDENIFRVINAKVENNIKENAYIDKVSVHKILPDTIEIEVEERKINYMIEYGNGYVYLSSQGYMIDISSIKEEVPILQGISTPKEEYKSGNRLNDEDLSKLGTVIKIMNSAENNGISDLITRIDISDDNNYTLYLESKNKVAYLGDCSNLETRMLLLVGILEKEEGNAGEIFINMNLNTDNAYFRESV